MRFFGFAKSVGFILFMVITFVMSGCQVATLKTETHEPTPSTNSIQEQVQNASASAFSVEEQPLTENPRAYDIALDPLIQRGRPQAPEEFAAYYLNLSQLSGMLQSSWTEPSELSPDVLTLFYSLNTLIPKHPYGWFSLELPAEEVEPEIQQYFNVTSEHLRKSDVFQSGNRSYSFSYGIGSTSWVSLDKQTVQGKECSLDYTIYGALDQIVGTGILKAEVISDRAYRFTTCQYQEQHE